VLHLCIIENKLRRERR